MNRHPGSRAAGLALRPLLVLAGGYHLALGLAAFFVPSAFYDAVATFPPHNDHFIKDIGSFYVPLGAVMVVAAGRRSWRVPVLALTVGHYVLHTVSHLVDAEDAEPAWVGALTAGGIAALTVLFAWLLRQTVRERRERREREARER